MSERRRAERSAAGGWAARVRPGHRVHVVDLSAGGALLEIPRPLRPGAGVEVQFEGSDRLVRVSGTVVRCGVSALDPNRGPTYRAAISFADTFEWAREGATHDGYCVPESREHPARVHGEGVK
jgi:hypothetical protein